MVHVHARDPLLASLPSEALEALAKAYDDVLTRYAIQAGVQDGPQNQIESKPAIEAQVMPSEP